MLLVLSKQNRLDNSAKLENFRVESTVHFSSLEYVNEQMMSGSRKIRFVERREVWLLEGKCVIRERVLQWICEEEK